MKRSFGLIHGELEIKILILFILRRLPEAISIDLLAELTLCEDSIGYFNFLQCVEALVKTEHIKLVDSMYTVTKKGVRNGKATEESLPSAIRQITENSVAAVRSAQKRNSMIKAMHKTNEDGTCNTVLSLSDGLGDIVKIELCTVNEQQSLKIEEGFQKNAEKSYNALISAILEN